MGNLCSNSKAIEQTTNTQDTGARDADKTPQQKRYPYNWPAGAETVGYLTERQVKARMTMQSEQVLDLPDGFKFRWAAVSQCFGQCLAAAQLCSFSIGSSSKSCVPYVEEALAQARLLPFTG